MPKIRNRLTLFGVVASMLMIGCEPDPRYAPVCTILSVERQPEVFIINGEPDAGYKVLVTVKNIGQPGKIRVATRLGTSEGDWERVRSRMFEVNETQVLRFDFPDPTINASNIQAVAECRWP
ncbi:MAG: hypothetical protein MRJ68_15175 [Nitrospira sp.]|nr:hypothetical protein [Nitrospira sp.]